jgi:hypothetical protein
VVCQHLQQAKVADTELLLTGIKAALRCGNNKAVQQLLQVVPAAAGLANHAWELLLLAVQFGRAAAVPVLLPLALEWLGTDRLSNDRMQELMQCTISSTACCRIFCVIMVLVLAAAAVSGSVICSCCLAV